MKLYQICIALNPNLKEEEVTGIVEQISESLAKENFSVNSTAIQLTRYLGYPIKHFKQAHLLSMVISTSQDIPFPTQYSQKLKRDENILRHLILVKSEKIVNRKPVSVIEQLRPSFRQSHHAIDESKVFTGADSGTQSWQETAPRDKGAISDNQKNIGVLNPLNEPEKSSLEEIDKKLEELLK